MFYVSIGCFHLLFLIFNYKGQNSFGMSVRFVSARHSCYRREKSVFTAYLVWCFPSLISTAPTLEIHGKNSTESYGAPLRARILQQASSTVISAADRPLSFSDCWLFTFRVILSRQFIGQWPSAKMKLPRWKKGKGCPFLVWQHEQSCTGLVSGRLGGRRLT